MPIVPHDSEEKIRRAIRDAVAVDPLISLRSLQSVLERRLHRQLDLHYIAKLRKKVRREAVEETNRQEVVERLAGTKERYRIVAEKLQRIAFWSAESAEPGTLPPSYRDQINALKTIMQLDIALFGAEMDAGIFQRHIGTLEVEKRFVPLPPEMRSMIMQAFKAWGIGPPAPRVIDQPQQNNGNTDAKPADGDSTAGPIVVG